ncbi:MAG: FIG01964566: Predicted membrane protein, hemolysin III homolog, partial [uncultured Acidimicrobiales bacterium]
DQAAAAGAHPRRGVRGVHPGRRDPPGQRVTGAQRGGGPRLRAEPHRPVRRQQRLPPARPHRPVAALAAPDRPRHDLRADRRDLHADLPARARRRHPLAPARRDVVGSGDRLLLEARPLRRQPLARLVALRRHGMRCVRGGAPARHPAPGVGVGAARRRWGDLRHRGPRPGPPLAGPATEGLRLPRDLAHAGRRGRGLPLRGGAPRGGLATHL